ncbi:histidine phosphatase family protein [Butyrivibrio sp. VCD2006]|uniref:histidine phosphatase family protein n=1 Tax=Butyrivibrio sp. VCD2006 TaxID=1280664 RepID=UPI00047C609A|nr:histidine phosphatase family protein [Butyrivibrio sp. VCD2006]
MRIAIMRHGTVAHKWKNLCTSAEFDAECRAYDTAPLAEKFVVVQGNSTRLIYVSTLRRSEETARQLFGDVKLVRSKLINEVPLRSAFDTDKRLPLFFWYVMGRLQWLTGSKRQKETKRETAKRAEKFVRRIIENGEDCVVVTHGIFMHTLIPVLEKHGFKENDKGPGRRNGTHKVNYKNGEMIVMSR